MLNYPLVSVIIPTYKREQLLCDSIIDVLKQDYPNFEILVVDQTKTHEPETQTFLKEMAATGKIKLFNLDWASLPGARNYAIKRSAGEIILFIDDDVQLRPEFLTSHVNNYLENPEIGAVAGRVLDREKLATSGGKLEIEYLPPAAIDPALFLYHLDLVHTIKPQQVLTARGCNMSFRQEVFTKYNLRFDERFRGNAIREESDFCLQFRKTGYKIWYDPEAYLVHLGEESGGCHNISTQSLEYQLNFYHNHFLLCLKNLTFSQIVRFCFRIFDCHVLGNPPCNKSGSPIKVLSRSFFYFLGFLKALATIIQSIWNNGQIYSKLDQYS
ncbi:hormogonium polysaccharide biosynthesis glycosyltransferase HpsN [Anabaena sp. UHCC 0204]|uniref:hormogonium polysaccharide biosynthesis glycosyltransferase HpsN n=1 Tax=Anabaena sp. UHCC 0204 TaxID=2590009 RepID=UPI001444E9C8|nr:hormogonium polysaccharide biosynthesis glycosyltransferase HpsN [Anabaena sp. UHCC 0204]MTJ06471.1 glycosyltransferase family 2 protein [Anabaena sp. UHCC 0204]